MSTLLRALVCQAVRSGTGTQDFTSGVFSGVQPKAAVCIGSFRGVNTVYTNTDGNGYGFYDGTVQRCLSYSDRDSQNPSVSKAAIYNDFCVIPFNGGGVADRATASFISGGVRLNWTIQGGFNNNVCVLLLGGDAIVNVSLLTSSYVFSGIGDTNNIAVGHSTHFMLCSGLENANSFNTEFNNYKLSRGLVSNGTSGLKQSNMSAAAEHNVNPSNCARMYSQNRALSECSYNGSTAEVSGITVGSFTSAQFTETAVSGIWGGIRKYLAFELASDFNADMTFETKPGATGNKNVAVSNLTPRLFFMLDPAISSGSLNTSASGSQNAIGIVTEASGAFTHRHYEGYGDDNVTPTNTEQELNDSIEESLGGATRDDYVITASTTNQYTENHTTANTTNEYSTLTIGEKATGRIHDFMPFFGFGE